MTKLFQKVTQEDQALLNPSINFFSKKALMKPWFNTLQEKRKSWIFLDHLHGLTLLCVFVNWNPREDQTLLGLDQLVH